MRHELEIGPKLTAVLFWLGFVGLLSLTGFHMVCK